MADNGDSLTLPRLAVLVPGMTDHDEYGNCLPDTCDCDYARECRAEDDEIPVCTNCGRAIWLHIYGDEGIWRHFDGFMLCQPNEDAANFNGEHVATPYNARCTEVKS